MIKCGAFWSKVSKAGVDYFSGELTLDGKKIKVVMFSNTKKEKANQPDLQMYLSEEKKENIPF